MSNTPHDRPDDARSGHRLTHLDERGEARMVDVSSKDVTERTALAEAIVRLSPEAFAALRDGTLKKGDAIATARIAGIMAAKRTPDLIPLCHPLPLSSVALDIDLEEEECIARIRSRVAVTARTGVEMEALTAATVAALAIYDMCKAIDKGIVIERVRLLEKHGGASGDFELDTTA